MNRRDFLLGAGATALSLALPNWALADEATFQGFQHGARKNKRLNAIAGVDHELSGVAKVEGRWPRDLNGVFYRNGPGRFELSGQRYHHLFDGDGMVQAWQIADGKISHRGRFVQTQKFREETAAGQFIYPAFGTPGIASKSIANVDTVNVANTNVLHHHGKLYALWEAGSAHELNPHTLETIGIKTWRDDLKAMPFTAHPKVEADGSWWSFGVFNGRIMLYQIAAHGDLQRAQVIEVPGATMAHDFVVTEHYLVFLLPPLTLDFSRGRNFLDMLVWQGDQAMRAVVVSKDDLQLKQIIELPAAMVFHFGNGWDRDGIIRLDAVLYDDASVMSEMRGPMAGLPMSAQRKPGRSMLMTLNLHTGRAEQQLLLQGAEFPVIDPRRVAQQHHQLFVLTEQGQRDSIGMSGLARIDLAHERIERFEQGSDWVVEEHVVVPKRHGKAGSSWLLGVAFDVKQQQSVLQVFDSQQLSQGPLARARLPYRTPLCFHGCFAAS